MIFFFQEFHQHWPLDAAPIYPSCCQDVLAKLTVTSEPNKLYVQWVYVCKRATVYIVSTITSIIYCVLYNSSQLICELMINYKSCTTFTANKSQSHIKQGTPYVVCHSMLTIDGIGTAKPLQPNCRKMISHQMNHSGSSMRR